MTDNPLHSMNVFSDLLSSADGQKLFFEAVAAAHGQLFGRVGGPYNVDSVANLAVAIECHHYAAEHMVGKPRFSDPRELLSYAIDSVSIEGLVLEFGVYTGNTINYIADLMKERTVYGFDSFEGLPEDWVLGVTKGFFAVERLPAVRDNVTLVVGWFDRTIPPFLDQHPADKAALIHIDSDIYRSTQTILAQLTDRIVPGTIIVFDEYFNYPGWRRHEFRAFQEWVSFRNLRYEYIGLVPHFEQVAVRIL